MGKRILVVLLAVCVLVSGCSGTDSLQDAAEQAEQQGGDGGDSGDSGGGGDGASGSSQWCPEGQTRSQANPQTGEQVTMEIRGIVDYEGRQVCKMVWETSQPENDIARVEYFFTQDGSFARYVYYDAEGNVINEFQASGGGVTVSSGEGAGTQVQVEGESSGEFCDEGQSMSRSNPQSGDTVSFTVEGIVTRDGQQVCKAVWETDNPDGRIARIEYFFTEDESYRELVYYDAEGNVIFQVEGTPGQ